MDGGAWWAAVHGVAKSRTWLNNFIFTFHFPALEKEMATHSSVLAWRIPGTREPCGLPSLGSHRVGHDWSDLAAAAAAAAATKKGFLKMIVVSVAKPCPTLLWLLCSLQTSLSMGFPRQKYWSGLPCPPPWDLPNPGIKPASLRSALAGRFFTLSHPGSSEEDESLSFF